MIIHYSLEESTFVVVLCRLLVQQKYQKVKFNACFKLNGKQMIKTVKNVNMFDLKIKKGK